MISYCRDFERMFNGMKRNILDATEGGLPIKGTTPVRLNNALKEFAIKEIPSSLFSLDADTDRLNEKLPLVVKKLEKLHDDSKDLAKTYEEMLSLINRIENRLGKGKGSNQLIEELHVKRSSLGKHEKLFSIIQRIAPSDYRFSVMEDRQISAEKLEGVEKQLRQIKRDKEFLGGLRNACRYFTGVLQGTISELRAKNR